MIAVTIRGWAAWSPGIETKTAWREWAENPRPLLREGAPEVRFVSAMLRRRCDQLSRMMLHVAHESAGDHDIKSMRSVFASRYGSISTMLSMLGELAVDAPLSPTRFSHSVHNTQAGLFSIWAKNPAANTSIAARGQTFAHGFLESASVLHSRSSEEGPVLLVVGDEPIPDSTAIRPEPDEGAYAFAVILGLANGAGNIELSIAPGAASQHSGAPDALHFLRWLLSDEPSLRLAYPERTWIWARR